MTTEPLSSDGVCETRRRVPHTPARILAAFASADLLARWWGPEGFSNTFEVFEFRAGGRWTLVMHGPDGVSYPNQNEFVAVGPERVVIRHVNAPLFTLTVTLLAAAGGGGTELHWHQAFDDPQLAQRIRHIVAPANEQNLDRLQRVLAVQAVG